MSTSRIYIERTRIFEGRAKLNGDERRYLLKVLRLREGDTVQVSDGEGRAWSAKLEKIDAGFELVTGELLQSDDGKPKNPLVLVQCLPKGERIKLVLHQATELGVDEIYFAVSERTIARPDLKKSTEKLTRFNDIVKQASALAGRARLPILHAPEELQALLKKSRDGEKLFFWEEETENMLRDYSEKLDTGKAITVVIGPEGGFSKQEAALARDAGFTAIGLGETVLRVDTAVAAIISLLQYFRNKLG